MRSLSHSRAEFFYQFPASPFATRIYASFVFFCIRREGGKGYIYTRRKHFGARNSRIRRSKAATSSWMPFRSYSACLCAPQYARVYIYNRCEGEPNEGSHVFGERRRWRSRVCVCVSDTCGCRYNTRRRRVSWFMHMRTREERAPKRAREKERQSAVNISLVPSVLTCSKMALALKERRFSELFVWGSRFFRWCFFKFYYF